MTFENWISTILFKVSINPLIPGQSTFEDPWSAQSIMVLASQKKVPKLRRPIKGVRSNTPKIPSSLVDRMLLSRAFAAKAVLYQMGVCERPAGMRKDDKGQPTDNFDDLIDELGAL